MAKSILQKYPIHFTHEEFKHCQRALQAISNRAGNLERIFEAVGKRSADEFRATMAIIKKGGAL